MKPLREGTKVTIAFRSLRRSTTPPQHSRELFTFLRGRVLTGEMFPFMRVRINATAETFLVTGEEERMAPIRDFLAWCRGWSGRDVQAFKAAILLIGGGDC